MNPKDSSKDLILSLSVKIFVFSFDRILTITNITIFILIAKSEIPWNVTFSDYGRDS